MSFPYPIVTVEEHWFSQSIRDFYVAKGIPDPCDEKGLIGYVIPALMGFGDERVRSMDEGGINVQVVSSVPDAIAVDSAVCTKVNDELHGLVRSKPGRFAAFANLPMAEPEAASTELTRCVKELGFVGAMIASNCEGKFFDDSKYWSVFETAERLDVPIYIHPAPNEQTKALLYDGNYPPAVAEVLSQYGWGWHNETAIHFLRLFSAGLFDKHPRLKLMIGHLGEMLPFQLDRIERISDRAFPHLGVKLNRKLRQVWDENVWITVAGLFFTIPFEATLKQCKPDRIIYSVDYPFGDNKAGLEFLKKLQSEGIVSDEVLEGIAYKNAANLLRLDVK